MDTPKVRLRERGYALNGKRGIARLCADIKATGLEHLTITLRRYNYQSLTEAIIEIIKEHS